MRLKISSFVSVLALLMLSNLFAIAQTASFTATPTTGCAPVVVNFNNTSTGTGLTYLWDFGNGITSTLKDPSTVYLSAGTYTVKLRVKTPSGAMDSVTHTNMIVVSAPPTVSFSSPDSASVICGTKTATFLNTTTLNASGGGTYKWDFGTGTTVTTTSSAPQTHTYSSCGLYSVTLVAINSAGCESSLSKPHYINVPCKPVAAFSSPNNTGCGTPYTVNFNAGATTGATSYTWNFGDGTAVTTVSSATTSHAYAASGTYTVTLIATSANGCKDTLVKPGYVIINKTKAQFTPATSTTCVNIPVSFINSSTPGTGSSTWYFKWPSNASGDKSSAASPSYAYTTPGTYTVKLVYEANGCPDTATGTVTVNPKPAPAFTGSPLTACTPPLTVNFNNTTTGATSYTWLFGDGGTSTATSPSYNYGSAGSYHVSLIATNSFGCKDTLKKNNYVKIVPPTAVINGDENLGCAPASATFTLAVTSVTGTSGFSYVWNWGDGTPNTSGTSTSATHTYATAGTYTITVTGTKTGGCTFTTTKTVKVGNKPTAGFTLSPSVVCFNSPVSFTNTSTAATSYQWYFGDGGTSTQTNPTRVFANPGIFNVMLVASDAGCSDTTYQTVEVKQPKANFTKAIQNCSDRKTICFTDASTSSGPTTYAWDFGVAGISTDVSSSPNPCYTYAANGVYSVKLTVTNLTTGCTDVKSINVRVFDFAASMLSADTSVCVGQTANFTAYSAAGYNRYFWNWGDGSAWEQTLTPSTSHVYSAPGAYTVKLAVRDEWNCMDTITLTNYVKVKGVVPGFTATPTAGCKPLNVHFEDTGTPIYSTITDRTWYFGDSPAGQSTGSISSVNHTYTSPYVTYPVKLVYVMDGGCTDSITIDSMITTYGPVADFAITSDTNVCSGAPITLVNNSYGAPVTHKWFFPNGTTSTNPNPGTYVTSGSGVQQIKLVVGIPGVCNDTMTKTIRVQKITAGFNMSDSVANCPPLNVNFTNTTTISPIAPMTFSWDFGNGASSSTATPNTIYNSGGTFHPKLVVTSELGCKDSISKNIFIDASSSADFSYASVSGCVPQSACISVTNIVNSTNLVLDFQDGSTYSASVSGADTVICHDFNQTGAFSPVLIMSNIGTGCYSIIQSPDTIKAGQPRAGFMAAPNPVCQFAPVTFTDTSSDNSIPLVSWSWDFGDPASGTANTSTLQHPTHAFTGTGTRTIRLIVTDETGCKDSTTRTIVVNTLPAVNAGADKIVCMGSSTTLTATGATTYTWTPAGSGLSCYNCASPVATPAATTTYYVEGTSTTTGCKAKDTIVVTVAPLPPAPAVSGTPVNYCVGAIATALTATVSGPGYTLNWYTAATGGTPLTSAPVPSTATAGTFTWYVSQSTPLTAGKCEGPRVPVSVVINPLPAAPVVASPVTYCQGATAAPLTATPASAHTLVWYTTATGGTGSTTAPVPGTSTAGTTTYYVSQKKTATGCEGTRAAINVIIAPLPAAPAVTNVTYCLNAPASPLTATPAAGHTLNWYTSATGGTPLPGAPTPLTTALGTFTWYVSQVNTSLGCEGPRAPVTATITTTPSVSAGLNQTICLGSSVTLTATGASTYTWTPGTGLSGTTGASVTANPVVTTTYTVTGSLGSGCSDTGQVIVTVVPVPAISVTPANTTICVGDTVALMASGAATYTWSPAAGLSSTSGSNVSATPTATTMYQVVGAITTSGVACYDTATAQVIVNPKPTITVSGVDSICKGGSTTLTAAGGFTYSWSPATGLSATTGATVTANPSVTTTYTITGTSETGCVNTATVTVTVNPLPLINAGVDTSVCLGGSVPLNATPATGLTFAWSPAAGLSSTTIANPIATPAATTSYVLTATNSFGCSKNDTVTVTVWTPPVVTATSSSAGMCPGDTAQLTASGALTYVWTPAAGLTSTVIANPKAFPTTTTTYTVTGTDLHGCTDTAMVTVNVNTPPIVSAGPAVTICKGSSTTLTATGAATYVWSPATGLSSTTVASPTANPLATTTYTVIGTDANGCKDTASVTVNVQNLPVINAGLDTSVCLGFGVALSATPATGLTYAWTPTAGLSSTTIPNPVATPATTTSYVVTGTDAFGCQGKDTVVVTVWTPPVVTATSSVTGMCPGDTAQLTATGALSYVWSPATALTSTTIANPKAYPVATTLYSVIGTDAHGCKDTATVNVVVNTPPTVSAGPDLTICIGSSATLNATGAVTYVWSPATGLSSTTVANPTANPATTTTYTVIGTSAEGCKDTATITVNVLTSPPVNAGPDTSVCLGSSVQLNATGTSGMSFTWSPVAGLSSGTIPNPVASPTVTTTYVVSGTDGFGCTGSDTIVVTVHTPPVVAATNSAAAICPGDTTQLNATGAATYVWTPAATLTSPTIANPQAFPLTTTTYTVIGTDVNGCKDTATVSVNVNTPPVVTVSPDADICAGTDATLTASGADTYTWTPSLGLSGTAGTTVTASPTITTTYTVVGTDANGCKDTATSTVTVHALPVVNAGLDTSVCLGSGVQLNATPTAGLTFAWTPAAGLSSTTVANPMASPAVTTTYTVTATDAFGCSGSDTITVTVWTPPVVTATSSSAGMCPGDSAQLTATGALTYVWTPAAGLTSTVIPNPKAFPNTTTTYTVTGTDLHGCTDTAMVTVNVNTPPVVSAGPAVTICKGSSTTLTATGAATYVWSPATGLSSTTVASPTANPLATTTYTVIGTDANGCKDTASVTVNVQNLPVVNAGLDTSVCLGFGVALSATPASGLTYAWTPTAGLSSTTIPNPVATPATTTSYVVTGTDAFGCQGKDTVVVTVWTPPVVTATSSVTGMCPGDTAQLTATGALSYVWSPATALTSTTIANPKAYPVATTLYSVIGTDAHGCKDTATVNVVVNTPPTVSAGGSYDVCLGSSVTLNATGAATYVWSPATGLSSTTIANPVATPTDTIVYTVIGTNANGCKDTATATVFTHKLPVINAGVDTSVCPGFGVQLNATPTAGLTFAWTPAAGLSSTVIPNPMATPTVATTYTVTATDAFGCVGRDSVKVSIRPVPDVAITASQDSICKWGVVTLNASGAFTYQWQPGGSLSSTITPTVTATTTYTVIGTNAVGCKDTVSKQIVVYPELNISVSPDVTICEGASTELSASGAATYAWTPDATLSSPTGSTTLAMPDTNTVYTVIGTDLNGCKDTASVRVLVIPMQPMSAGPGGTICKGGEWRLNATGGSSYSWSPATGLSNPNIANPVARPEETTTYTVTITQGNCFVETFQVTVVVNPTASVQLDDNLVMVAGDSIRLNNTHENVDQFLWTPADGLSCINCPEPMAAPARTTTYTVYATNSFGCNDTASITVTVNCDGTEIWLPNTFTPNGDGHNDRFYARGKGVTVIESFRIYNRWGEAVYDVKDIPVDNINFSWDGTYKGKPLSPDVYMYIIKASCGFGEAIQIKGDITLIR